MVVGPSKDKREISYLKLKKGLESSISTHPANQNPAIP